MSAMIDVVVAVLGLASACIFAAHAIEAYRLNWPRVSLALVPPAEPMGKEADPKQARAQQGSPTNGGW